MTKQTTLFSPIALGRLALKNRMVMAPLTRNRAGEGNVPRDLNVEYYRQRASAGLIISEASQVSEYGVGYPATPGIHSAEQIHGWRKVTDAVHQRGGKIVIQLWYCGRISHPSLLPNNDTPVSASAIKPQGNAVTYSGLQAYVQPRELSAEEIGEIVDQFRRAAHNAKAAGFDGIEVHAANGYLIDQFLRDGTNHRTDTYGGSVQNRTRFLLEIMHAVLEAWEPGCVGVRISPENTFNDIRDSDPQTTFNYVAEQLDKLNIAFLHVLEGDMATGDRKLDYRQLKHKFAGYYMANNGYDKKRAMNAIRAGDVDLVAFGKLFLANPDLVERFAQDAPLNTPDPSTFYGGDAHGYTDYPVLKKEAISA